ncbi:MAG: VWA domain-containing protein [Treponema sp.]|nr:VWA domain-containing protein [Treponema sp.]
MSFQNPTAFFLLLLIPVYWVLRKLNIFRKPSITAVLSDWNGELFQWKDGLTRFFYSLSKITIYAGFILTIAALSDPVNKHQEKIFTTRGTDILFVLDTSPSMVAKDVNGKTRLEASKEAVENLFLSNPGTRCGIVTLGSEAAVLVPPTNDFDSFRSRLKSIQAGSMGDGSAIGTGLSTAVYHLISSAAPKKCIVLFTDGENNAGEIHPETAAELAARNNITVYVFGVGTKGTVSIDYTDPVTGKKYSGYLNSDFDSASLRNISTIGNGKYFEASTVSQLEQALDLISRNENISQDFTYKTILTSYYKNIIHIVLFLFIFGWVLTRILMKYRKIIPARSICMGLSFLFLILSLSNLSWGTTMVPTYKSSNAVSFVFDISNSMSAKDETEGLSRLQAASVFSKKLLSKFHETPVSVILCKGDGVTAIPLTEDYAQAESLLSSLSTSLMSAPGTNLGKGILAAKNSFPENISSSNHIWVFTDGEDKDNNLQQAFSECIKKGISVKIIGFGTEEGKDISAGDNKTIVHSSLQKDFIESTIDDVSKKFPTTYRFAKPEFLIASNYGTGTKLLHSLEKNPVSNTFVSFEEKSVNRFKEFLGLAIFFFVLGYILSEMKISTKSTLLTISIILLSSCSKTQIKRNITDKTFKGAAFYKQQEFEKATGEFFETFELSQNIENQILKDYALYNISTAYLMSNEKEAALEKLSQISADAPSEVKYNAFFNAGVIYYHLGDRENAAVFFRKALETDSTRIEAKINLELSLKTNETVGNETQGNMLPSGEDSSFDFDNLEKTVFERIKENDKKQWKNSENTKTSDLSSDY